VASRHELILKLPDGFACKCAAGLPTAGYATTVTLTETDRAALSLAIERVRAQDAGRAQQTIAIEETEVVFSLSIRMLRSVLRRFRTNLDDGLCLIVERIQLLTHKLGLDFHHVLEIFRLAKFLYKVNSSDNVVRRIAQKFFI
jgi:hypothetical protein